jgi:hypothetical protein
VLATKGGKPLSAHVRADALVNGSVVRHIGSTALKRGVYVVRFPWPQQAVGVALSLRFTIEDGATSQTFLYPVTVRPAPR